MNSRRLLDGRERVDERCRQHSLPRRRRASSRSRKCKVPPDPCGNAGGAQAAAVQITDAHTRMKSRGWFEQLVMRLVVRPAPRFRGWLFRSAMVLLGWAVDPQSTDGFFDGWHLFRSLAGCSGVGTLFDRWRAVRGLAPYLAAGGLFGG